jgi:hypothetical protein
MTSPLNLLSLKKERRCDKINNLMGEGIYTVTLSFF